MSNRIHALAQQLTGKATIEECSLDEVKHIVKRHPFFAPAQFLLLQKLQQLNSPEAEGQYRKAVLFYHDPLLFNYFISSNKFYVDEESLLEESHVVITNDFNNEISIQSPVTTEPLASDSIIEEVKTQVDGIDIETNSDSHISHLNLSELTPEAVNGQAPGVMAPDSEQSLSEAVEIENKESENVAPLPSPIQLEREISSTVTEASELTFEPFHTVDYFASQGIKISQEELPKDKLGKQLKSFTEWLKTMKRIPASQASESAETSAVNRVETMAEKSVSKSDVVTEAMAEVWAKQGNREKAMETYNKLSLLNPSKRAYFAAKIENLKHS